MSNATTTNGKAPSQDVVAAVSELCHLAGLDGQLAAGDLGLKNAVVFEVKVVDVCHFVSSFNRLGRAAAAFLALETKTKRNGKWRMQNCCIAHCAIIE